MIHTWNRGVHSSFFVFLPFCNGGLGVLFIEKAAKIMLDWSMTHHMYFVHSCFDASLISTNNQYYIPIFSQSAWNNNDNNKGANIGPPPDLPSLLLHNRIVYIGMPLVPAVTELVIAELLYLNYEDQSKPVTMYINSSGTTTANGQSVGFETEAFAIADVMKYIRPPVNTVAIGQAFGAAAMILSQGQKGGRAALPNATIRLNQPRSQAQGQASDIAIRAREVAHNRKTTCELIAQATGKPLSVVMDDCQRVKYLQPDEAVEYGLIDRVIRREEMAAMMKPSFLSQLN